MGHGEHLVEDDLRRLLDSSRLAGAVPDVFEPEPPEAAHGVWSLPRVRVTPHIAAQAGVDAVAQPCLEAWQRVCRGERPGRAVDLAALGLRHRPSGPARTEDTAFPIFSTSKPVVSKALMMRVEGNRPRLRDPAAWVPFKIPVYRAL